MKLLLHTCCAPCSVYCIKSLREEGIEPTLYWYNPNIQPYSEYKARRDCLKQYAEQISVELIVEDYYGLDEFCREVAGDIVNRCRNYCYPHRLRRVVEFAREHDFDTVSTTLLYSIYQQHDYIADLLDGLARECGLAFLYRDFREGWQAGQDEARAVGLYMQKYCGCVFSEEESMVGREIGRKLQKAGIAPTNANVRKLIDANKVAGELAIQQLKKSV